MSKSMSLDELIQKLRALFRDSPKDLHDQLGKAMADYKSNRDDWEKYALFDPHRYTRNLVDQGNQDYNLIVLCWNEGQGSSIHDHSKSSCYMKILEGSLAETQFEWPAENKEQCEAGMIECGTPREYGVNDVAYIDDSIGLHRIENPSHSDTAVSLHLYSPPFDMCQTFDVRTGHVNSVKFTFCSKFGTKTPCKP